MSLANVARLKTNLGQDQNLVVLPLSLDMEKRMSSQQKLVVNSYKQIVLSSLGSH